MDLLNFGFFLVVNHKKLLFDDFYLLCDLLVDLSQALIEACDFGLTFGCLRKQLCNLFVKFSKLGSQLCKVPVIFPLIFVDFT